MNLNDYQRAIQLAENSEVFQTVPLFREKSIRLKILFFLEFIGLEPFEAHRF